MKRKRFAVEQIVAILKQAELGIPIVELIRQVGVSEQTTYTSLRVKSLSKCLIPSNSRRSRPFWS